MLASSLREEAQATVSTKPGHRGDHEVRRKTIRVRECRRIRWTCGDYARVLVSFRHARLRVYRAPGIPHALFSRSGETILKTRAKSRREIAEAWLVIAAPDATATVTASEATLTVIASAAKQSISPR